MRTLEQISCLINDLTNDQDMRQDLWVYYLEDKPIESFESKLVRLKVQYSEDLELQEAIWHLVKNPPSHELTNFINDNFTDFERSIMCCLMLGLNASKISELKGISEVRIRQSIATIRYNSIWKENYGFKEKLIR